MAYLGRGESFKPLVNTFNYTLAGLTNYEITNAETIEPEEVSIFHKSIYKAIIDKWDNH